MKGLEQILPFYQKAAIKSTTVTGVKVSTLFKTPEIEEMVNNLLLQEKPDAIIEDVLSRDFNVLIIQPLGISVIEASDYETAIIYAYFETISALVTVVDYIPVAHVLDFGKNSDGENVAFYPQLDSSVEVQEITSADYALKAYDGESVCAPCEFAPKVNSLRAEDNIFIENTAKINNNFNEAARDMDADDFDGESDMEVIDDSHGIILRSYFLGNYTLKRTPMLVGASGVAKSATVKALTKEFGMRLVDIRLAFTARTDIGGLSEKEQDATLGYISKGCPSSLMVQCSDGYIDFCDNAARIIESRTGSMTDKEKANIAPALAKFKEGAKIPVFFLDEITRAPQSVRQAFTKILTDKEFMGYSMSKARVIAATNSPVGIREVVGSSYDDELANLYLSNEGNDKAFFDRFEPLRIFPENIRGSWKAWAKKKDDKGLQNIHPLILEFLENNEDDYYNYKILWDKYQETEDVAEVSMTPFPNYRTWEMITRHLNANDTKKEFDREMITGLIGKDAGERFCKYLAEDKGWKEKQPPEDGDNLMDKLRQGMDGNVPVMMITPSSIGKSSRIRALQKETNAELIDINLAEQDRVDLLGIPGTIPITDYILRNVSGDLPADIKEEITASISDYDLPEKITDKFPKRDIQERLYRALASGKQVIVHFDELNRVQNPNVMSAVFEAVSDNRVLGVTFPPGMLRVFCSCNAGSDYGDAKRMDPAFAARFSIYKQNIYTQKDAESFYNYMKKKNFSPIIMQYFEEALTDMSGKIKNPEYEFKDDAPEFIKVSKAVEILASVETRTLENSSASSRAWDDLDKFLKDEVNIGIMQGAMLFYGPVDAQNLANDVLRNDDDDTIIRLIDAWRPYMKRWAGLKSQNRVTFANGQVWSAEDLMDTMLALTEKIRQSKATGGHIDAKLVKNFKILIKKCKEVEKSIVETRKDIFACNLGDDYGTQFGEYYNIVSGRTFKIYTIEDCVTANIWYEYIEQVNRNTNSSADFAINNLAALQDYVKAFPSVTSDMAREIIRIAFDKIGRDIEAKQSLLTNFMTTESLITLGITAENKQIDWTSEFFRSVGIVFTQEETEKVKGMVEF